MESFEKNKESSQEDMEIVRKRLSEYFFGKEGGNYEWGVLAQQYRSLEKQLDAPHSWTSGAASDILANMAPEDEEILKKWIADHESKEVGSEK